MGSFVSRKLIGVLKNYYNAAPTRVTGCPRLIGKTGPRMPTPEPSYL